MQRFLPLILLALIPSCVASYPVNYQSGADFDASKASELVLNESTMADVQALFGPPAQTAATVSGLTIWNYSTMSTSADRRGNTSTMVQQMQIHMRDGVVVDYFAQRM